MAKRKWREDRPLRKCAAKSVVGSDGSMKEKGQEGMPLHKKKLHETESAIGSVSNVKEMATPKKITPSIKFRPIFVVEQASLKVGVVGKKRKILSAFHDATFLLKKGKNLDDYRPDICYEALHEILDSRLNKKGGVGAVYVRTDSGVLFEVNPNVRIPRTRKRFNGVMLDLLDKSCVRAEESGEILFRILKGPLTQYLPENARILGLSYSSPKTVDVEDYVSAAGDDLSLVFVVGAMVKGKVSKDGVDDYISVSDYALSAGYCLGLVCEALEQKWRTQLQCTTF